MILCPVFVRKKHSYSDFDKKFIDTLNKHAPKKFKTFWGNQKPDINKTLRKAIMKRSHLKNKANKTWNAVDILNYKKQRNYVVKLNKSVWKGSFWYVKPWKRFKTILEKL